MICFAAVAVTADTIAKICRSYWSPTDIVARSKNPGKGTKGTKEPKKLTKARRRYPTSGANGKISTNSTNQTIFRPYLIKSRTKKDTIH